MASCNSTWLIPKNIYSFNKAFLLFKLRLFAHHLLIQHMAVPQAVVYYSQNNDAWSMFCALLLLVDKSHLRQATSTKFDEFCFLAIFCVTVSLPTSKIFWIATQLIDHMHTYVAVSVMRVNTTFRSLRYVFLRLLSVIAQLTMTYVCCGYVYMHA